MITDNGNRWHYIAVKSLPALLRTSNHHGDFYCLSCFHSYATHNKLSKQERVCNNHDYCPIDMPKTMKKWEKPLKVSFIIYADLECLLKKNVRHKPSRYAWCSICLFDDMKNRPYFYRGKDCIKKFCKDLKKLGMKIINFEEKKVIPLTNKQMKSYETQKVCHICKEKFCNNKNKKRSLSLHQKI